MKDIISIIIPVYNVKPYLKKCLDSVINQTYKNLEIILIDDGSNDGSGEICDEYGKLDKRIMVVHQSNQGLSMARNKGLDLAKGDWIAFLDSDDWVEKDMYETLYKLAVDYNADISSCNTYIHTEKFHCYNDTINIKVFSRDELILGLRTQEVVRFEVWNKLWKRDLIGNIRFKKGQVCEDIYFDHIIFLKTNKFVYTSKPLHHYLVQRPGNTNSNFRIGKMEGLIELHEFVEDLKKIDKKELSEAIASYAFEFAISFYISAKISKQDKCLMKSIKREIMYFKNQAKHSKYINKKVMYLFAVSPRLFYFVSKLKNRR